jgi:hypothetical protein
MAASVPSAFQYVIVLEPVAGLGRVGELHEARQQPPGEPVADHDDCAERERRLDRARRPPLA